MGDDTGSHLLELEVDERATLDDLASAVLRMRFLAGTAVGQATWVMEGSHLLAVLAQQWTEPRYLIPPSAPVLFCIKPAPKDEWDAHIYFRYWVQDDPDMVFEEIRRTGALPSKRGITSRTPASAKSRSRKRLGGGGRYFGI